MLIMRYSNRKLYDRSKSRYVTLAEIAGDIRNGDTKVQVVARGSGDDVTLMTLAQAVAAEIAGGATCSVEQLVVLIRSMHLAAKVPTTPVGDREQGTGKI